MRRTIVTSDWHGLADRARSLIEKTRYDSKTDELVIMGDLIDRGPDSLGCVRYARELENHGAIVLMGNHEDMAIRAYQSIFTDVYHPKWENDDLVFHMSNGGDNFWEQVRREHPNLLEIMRWFDGLPLSYQPGNNYVCVHAGYNTQGLMLQTREINLWARDFMFRQPRNKNITVVFGHTPTNHLREDGRHVIYRDEGLIGVDCGGVFPGGLLAAISLPDGEEFYA